MFEEFVPPMSIYQHQVAICKKLKRCFRLSKEHPELNVVRYEKNRGLGIALHDGLLECKNEIIFRMDTDDICLPTRFEKQLKIFKKDKSIDIVGSNITEFDETMENSTSERIVPETDSEIKVRAKKRNPMNHMTVAYKKDAVIKAGNYQDMMYFEDYYLWVRMMINNCKFYNVQETLVNVRGGKTFTIEAENNSKENKYIQKVFLNGKPYKKTYVTYDDIINGSTLKFVMGKKPNKSFGKAMADRPIVLNM